MREDDKMRWENILSGIDDKYVSESAEFLAKGGRMGQSSDDYFDSGEPDMVIPPQPVKKGGFAPRVFAVCAAAAAVAVAVPLLWGVLRPSPDIIDDGPVSPIGETVLGSSETGSPEDTAEATPEPTLHTMADFADKYGGDYCPYYEISDPIEAARQYVTEMNDEPYVSNFEIKDAYIYKGAVEHETGNIRKYVHLEGSIPYERGWTEDMVDRGIFTAVRVDYYANFDHTQTPTDFEGDCYVNVYMVKYEDTGWWQVYDHGYLLFEGPDRYAVSEELSRSFMSYWNELPDHFMVLPTIEVFATDLFEGLGKTVFFVYPEYKTCRAVIYSVKDSEITLLGDISCGFDFAFSQSEGGLLRIEKTLDGAHSSETFYTYYSISPEGIEETLSISMTWAEGAQPGYHIYENGVSRELTPKEFNSIKQAADADLTDAVTIDLDTDHDFRPDGGYDISEPDGFPEYILEKIEVLFIKAESYGDIGEPYIMEYQYHTARLPLFRHRLKANGREYDCEIFMYCNYIDYETEYTVRGLTAIELSFNGTVLDRKNIYTGSGLSNPAYPKSGGDGGYWSVLPLENDVVAYIAPSERVSGYAEPGYADAVFITVNTDGKLEWVTRHFSEEEMEEHDPHYSMPEMRFFTVTDNYRISGNRVDFSHPDGDFSATFDFEDYQLLCGSKEVEDIVYYYQ